MITLCTKHALSSMMENEPQPFSDHSLHNDLLHSPMITYNKACQIHSMQSGPCRFEINKETLAKKWGIGLIAEQTLHVTTQKGIQQAIHPLHRRFHTKQAQLQYNQLGGKHGRFYTDTFFATTKSTRQNIMAQIFTNNVGFTRIYPMKLKSKAPNALLEFNQDIGIPAQLHSDNAKEFMQGKWKQLLSDFQ